MSKDDNVFGADPFDGSAFDGSAVVSYGIGTEPFPNPPLPDILPKPYAPPNIPTSGSTLELEKFTTRGIHDKRLDFIKRLLDLGMGVLDACLLYTNCGKDINTAIAVYHLAVLCETDPVKLANNAPGLRGVTEHIIKACNCEEQRR